MEDNLDQYPFLLTQELACIQNIYVFTTFDWIKAGGIVVMM